MKRVIFSVRKLPFSNSGPGLQDVDTGASTRETEPSLVRRPGPACPTHLELASGLRSQEVLTLHDPLTVELVFPGKRVRVGVMLGDWGGRPGAHPSPSPQFLWLQLDLKERAGKISEELLLHGLGTGWVPISMGQVPRLGE